MNPIKNFKRRRVIVLLKKFKIKNYTINDDGTVDVDGNVNLSDLNLTSIPIPFGRITKIFNCSFNKLTSLKWCPHQVGADFLCFKNKLTSIDTDCKIHGCLYAWDNNFKSSNHGFSGTCRLLKC